MANTLEPIKNTESLLRTYYIAGYLKQARGPRVGQPWLKSLFADELTFSRKYIRVVVAHCNTTENLLEKTITFVRMIVCRRFLIVLNA